MKKRARSKKKLKKNYEEISTASKEPAEVMNKNKNKKAKMLRQSI